MRLPRRQFKALVRALTPPVVMPMGATEPEADDDDSELLFRASIRIVELERDLTILQSRLQQAENDLADREIELSQVKRNCHDLEAALNETSNLVSAANVQAAAALDARDGATRSAELYMKSYENMCQAAADAGERAELAEQHLADKKALTLRLEAELDAARTEIDALNAKLATPAMHDDPEALKDFEPSLLAPLTTRDAVDRAITNGVRPATDTLLPPQGGRVVTISYDGMPVTDTRLPPPPAPQPEASPMFNATAQALNTKAFLAGKDISGRPPEVALSRLARTYGAECQRRRDVDLMDNDEIARTMNQRSSTIDTLTGQLVAKVLLEMDRHEKARRA